MQKTLLDNITEEEKNDIITDYNNGKGLSIRKLAEKYGHSRPALSKMLKSLGKEVLSQRHDRKYYVNDSFFHVINNELNAYWLGFLYADGCILSPEYGQQKIQLTLAKTDEEILEKFLLDCDSTYPINYDNSKHLKNPNTQIQCIVRYSSQQMADDLKRLGCTERKSLILEFPTTEQVPNLYLYDFIRGYFDGDGSIFYSGKRWQLCITGTESFIKKLHNILGFGYVIKDNRKNNSWYLHITNKEEIYTFYNRCYNHANRFLQRKHEKFLDFIKYYESRGI